MAGIQEEERLAQSLVQASMHDTGICALLLKTSSRPAKAQTPNMTLTGQQQQQQASLLQEPMDWSAQSDSAVQPTCRAGACQAKHAR